MHKGTQRTRRRRPPLFSFRLDEESICLPLTFSLPQVPASHPERRPVLGRSQLLEDQVGEVRREVSPHIFWKVEERRCSFFCSFLRAGASKKKKGEERREKSEEEEKERRKRVFFFELQYALAAKFHLFLSRSLSSLLAKLQRTINETEKTQEQNAAAAVRGRKTLLHAGAATGAPAAAAASAAAGGSPPLPSVVLIVLRTLIPSLSTILMT